MSVISEVIGRILKVRTMVAADLPRLLQIEKQPLGSRYIRHALPLKSAKGDRGIWVATIQNAVVGYLVFQIVPEDEPLVRERNSRADDIPLDDTLPSGETRVEILHMFVAPNWRRQGIGRALTERFDPRPLQQGCCAIQATVPESDLTAQLTLRSSGYRAVRVLRKHLGDEDAYLMERSLG